MGIIISVVRSGCRACRFKQCEVAGMKAGLVRGKRDACKMRQYGGELVQQNINMDSRATLTIETIGEYSSKAEEMEKSPSNENEVNILLNVTFQELLQYYIELNNKSFYLLSRITLDSLPDFVKRNSQEATQICQNCPGADLLEVSDVEILFQYVSFSNLWLDGLWAEIQLKKFTESSELTEHHVSEELHSETTRKLFSSFISNLKGNVGQSLKQLNLDFVEYSALKSFCIWKLGILDFGTTLKIFAEEHYSGVSAALTKYYKVRRHRKTLNHFGFR
ncbi:hypothetical protein GCK72_013809 [Caenorhabditis remanei]|uniref:NR LBD domain-containing protein n=1 Tax=Caenorhabditis remanei TaxID=31234 RepID=A0A6A5GRT2_CAERE|nr:hypothetical protein GCK72_013809 [Caenorhabditis remanei]KAF1757354.1 hypothetical protein GCK72_013809 [Caenorhabditis remanei]